MRATRRAEGEATEPPQRDTRMIGRTAGAMPIETGDRDHLLERLQHLRSILPGFAQELASARRQMAALRVENRGLLEEVHRLRARCGESSTATTTHRR
jgi:hypothetical protein